MPESQENSLGGPMIERIEPGNEPQDFIDAVPAESGRGGQGSDKPPESPHQNSNPENENRKRFEPSWVVKSEEELKAVHNDSLSRRISRLHEAAKQPGVLSRDQWRDEYISLMHAANDDKYPEDAKAIDVFLLNMSEGIAQLNEGPAKPREPVVEDNSGNTNAQEIGRAIASAFEGRRMSDLNEYRLYQKEEEWQNQAFPPIDPKFAPGYFAKWNLEQQEFFNKRRELATAAFHKRRVSPPTLSDLSKAEGEFLAGLNKAETAVLYKCPGVKEALKLYFDLWEGRVILPGPEIEGGMRKASGTQQEMRYRNFIREKIRPNVGGRVKKESGAEEGTREFVEWQRIFAQDAEQIAFNLLYTGNTFESLDSCWENGIRTREMACFNKFVNVPIRNALHPLDALVATFKKKPAEVTVVGKFGEWAYRQVVQSAKGVDISKGFSEVQIIPETKEYKNKFWVVEDTGEDKPRLYAPECYPTGLIGSIWEETSVEVENGGNNKRTPLIEFLRQGRDIPWDDPSISDGFWGDYNGKLDKAGVIWDFLQGKNPIRWDDFENVTSWVRDVNNALSKFQKREVPQIKRWILYASCEGGVNAAIREPKLIGKHLKLSILSALGPKGSNYLPWNQLLFPWDQRGKF